MRWLDDLQLTSENQTIGYHVLENAPAPALEIQTDKSMRQVVFDGSTIMVIAAREEDTRLILGKRDEWELQELRFCLNMWLDGEDRSRGVNLFMP